MFGRGRRQSTGSREQRVINVESIVGSIRHIYDINEALAADADIVTVPPKFFPQLTQRPKTTEAVDQFLTDFRKSSEQPEGS